MHLNTLAPNKGATKSRKRVGRGTGSGFGKTCGRGHKGQKSRSGAPRKKGFEGGQMPLIRRLPKFGFTSFKATITSEVRLDTLEGLGVDEITVDTLKKFDVINQKIKHVKIINSGELTKALVLKGFRATKAAKAKIESLGGKLED